MCVSIPMYYIKINTPYCMKISRQNCQSCLQKTKSQWGFHQLWKFHSAYVVISRPFFWNSSFEDYPYKKHLPLEFHRFIYYLYTPKVVVPNVPKRNVFVKLSFLGSTLFPVRKKLQKLFSDKVTSCNLKIVFMSPVRVKSFFTFKDELPRMLLSGLVYQHKCGGCNATYYGKTKAPF